LPRVGTGGPLYQCIQTWVPIFERLTQTDTLVYSGIFSSDWRQSIWHCEVFRDRNESLVSFIDDLLIGGHYGNKTVSSSVGLKGLWAFTLDNQKLGIRWLANTIGPNP
jgi:hypothetical protein